MKILLNTLFAAGFVVSIISGTFICADAEVLTGRIEGWEESPPIGQGFIFDQHVSVTTNLEATWSYAMRGSTGWFYGDNSTTEVAIAGVTHISDVSDASTYTYIPPYNGIGPVAGGAIILFHNTATDYYGAFLLDDFPTTTTVDITWYLQDDGSGDFSSFKPAALPTGMIPLLLLQD